MTDKELRRLIFGVGFMFLGVLTMVLSMIMPSAESGFMMVLIGGWIQVLGIIMFVSVAWRWDKQRKIEEPKMSKAQQAIVWVWAVCFMGIAVYSLVWFTLGWAAMGVIDSVTGNYTFASPAASTVDFIRTMFAWHPIFFILGLLLWAFVNSQRREEATYPVY